MDLSFDSSKRRRTTLMAPLSLTDLPLTAIADYLPSANRIILAVALTTPSSNVGWNEAKLSTASKAVLASKEYWELDFAEVSDYAGDPSDDDLRALLLSIDAKNTLKSLRMRGCSQIVGHGLEPLRESTVLERLSLPYRLDKHIVIPIVYSIINAIYSGGQTLDRLGLLCDLQWFMDQAQNDTSSPLHTICTNIQQTILDNGQCEWCWKSLRDITCASCLKQVCTGCSDEFPPVPCNNCGVTFCEYCDNSAECNGCGSVFCSACAQLNNINAAINCSRCGGNCFTCSEGCGECHPVRYQKMMARINWAY